MSTTKQTTGPGKGSAPGSRANLALGHKSPKHRAPRGPMGEARRAAIRKALTGNPKIAETSKAAAKALHAQRPDLHGRGSERHINAREWFLIDPAGESHRVRNLVGFVLQNPGLFSPDDREMRVEGKASSIRAVAGIGQISPHRACNQGRDRTWKGWRWDHESELAATRTKAETP